MTVCKAGRNKLHRIVECAPEDIRRRLPDLYWLVRLLDHERVGGNVLAVELGTRRGDSTRALLAACEDCGGSLLSIDNENVGAHVKHVTESYGIPWFEAPWQFFHGDSVDSEKEYAALVGDRKIDLLFIDTDHTYETTHNEIAAWHQHVRVGGCMCFHDYWLDDPPPRNLGVKRAVDEFADAHAGAFRLETHDAVNDTGFAILWRVA